MDTDKGYEKDWFITRPHGYIAAARMAGMSWQEMAVFSHIAEYLRPYAWTRTINSCVYISEPGTVCFSQTHERKRLKLDARNFLRTIKSIADQHFWSVDHSNDCTTVVFRQDWALYFLREKNMGTVTMTGGARHDDGQVHSTDIISANPQNASEPETKIFPAIPAYSVQCGGAAHRLTEFGGYEDSKIGQGDQKGDRFHFLDDPELSGLTPSLTELDPQDYDPLFDDNNSTSIWDALQSSKSIHRQRREKADQLFGRKNVTQFLKACKLYNQQLGLHCLYHTQKDNRVRNGLGLLLMDSNRTLDVNGCSAELTVCINEWLSGERQEFPDLWIVINRHNPATNCVSG